MKKIYRSRKDEIVGGVCGGVAEYFEVDSTWVRLAFLFIFLLREVGLIIYIIAWIVIPEHPVRTVRAETDNKNGDTRQSHESEGDDHDLLMDNQGDDHDRKNKKNGPEKNKSQRSLGIILLIIGVFFLFERWVPHYRWERFWPLILVAIGVSLLLKGVKRK